MQNRVSVGSETEWRQHQQRGSSPVMPRVRRVSSVRQRWPHSSGHRRRHGRHDTPHSPALVHSLPLSLSRDSDGGNAIAIVAESSASFTCARPCVSPRLPASPSPPRGPPSSPPLGWTRSPRGEPHFTNRHRRVHGRRDPDSGEPRRCSVLASFLPSESR